METKFRSDVGRAFILECNNAPHIEKQDQTFHGQCPIAGNSSTILRKGVIMLKLFIDVPLAECTMEGEQCAHNVTVCYPAHISRIPRTEHLASSLLFNASHG
jgi:hypothetical protein